VEDIFMPKLPEDIHKWTDVDSSSIKQVSYDKENKILKVKFPNDKAYQYDSIGPKLVEDFLNSNSKGRFFHKRIRKKKEKYPFKRVASILSRRNFIGRMLTKNTLSEKWEDQNK
jgi:hypothetical protein